MNFAALPNSVESLFDQLRRQARLRREYLYRKSAEERERSIYERKKKLKAALEGDDK